MPPSESCNVVGKPQAVVGDRLFAVKLTDGFLECLDAIEAFLIEARAGTAYDALLNEMRAAVIPNLERFPRMGRRYLDHPPRSAEALAQLAQLQPGAIASLREYLHDDYLILYAIDESAVPLLSIRHHRQLTYDFARLWPSSASPGQK